MTNDQPRRIAGSAMLLLGLLIWGVSEHPGLVVLSWILFALGSYLITQAVFAILFTVSLLSGVQYALGNVMLFGEIRPAVFASISLIAGLAALAVLLQRFRSRIQETHDERWKDR